MTSTMAFLEAVDAYPSRFLALSAVKPPDGALAAEWTRRLTAAHIVFELQRVGAVEHRALEYTSPSGEEGSEVNEPWMYGIGAALLEGRNFETSDLQLWGFHRFRMGAATSVAMREAYLQLAPERLAASEGLESWAEAWLRGSYAPPGLQNLTNMQESVKSARFIAGRALGLNEPKATELADMVDKYPPDAWPAPPSKVLPPWVGQRPQKSGSGGGAGIALLALAGVAGFALWRK